MRSALLIFIVLDFMLGITLIVAGVTVSALAR